jgi:hypothetical protein
MTILIVEKDHFAAIAAVHHVIDSASVFDAQRTRHPRG